MRNGLRIGRIFGIDLTVDLSWVFIFTLVTWNLTAVFSHWHRSWGPAMSIGMAVVASLAFFASVVVHELAHSLVAKAHGIRVRNITLFMFGGVSTFEREPASPRVEFLSAIVGPLTSLILGVSFILIAGVAAGEILRTSRSASEALSRLGPITTLLVWLGPVNILLGLFNLIPGFPLDGGRVLRAILWAITRDLLRATLWASRVGQAIAWAFIVTGVAMAFGLRVPFFGTGLIGGLWLAFIGWFLNGASVQSYRQTVLRSMLQGVPIAQLMRTDLPWVSPATSVTRFVHDWMVKSDERSFPVLDGGDFVGMVTVDNVRQVPRRDWDMVPVSSIMTPADRIPTLSPHDNAADVLDKLVESSNELPVMDQGRLVGVLYRHDLARWLQLQLAHNEHSTQWNEARS